jgi:hypothetical protein
MNPVAPDRTRAAADVLADQHRDLEQHGADIGLVDRLPVVLDHSEAGRQRCAEVAVAGHSVEVREVGFVLEHGRRGGLDRPLDLALGYLAHCMLLQTAAGGGQLAEIGQRDVYVRRIAELGNDTGRPGEILVDGISAGRDQRGKPGAGRGEKAVPAVLDHHAFVHRQPERPLGELVDLGIGLLLRDHVAGMDERERRLAFGPEQVEHRVDEPGVRGGAHAELHARRDRLVDDPQNPRPAPAGSRRARR